MGDSSFPADYWTRFRQVVKATDPNALIVGELWPKDSTTLSFLAGQRADSTMNYRDRDAILGFLTTHTFDGKGLGDSGRVLAPSEFLSRLVSQQEDYAAPAYGDLMNLIDSHDTTRALWTLSPGAENDPAAKAAGQRRRQAPPAARVARAVHAAGHADRVLRRRGRRHRR